MNAIVRTRPTFWDFAREVDSVFDQLIRPVNGGTEAPVVRTPAIDVSETDSAYELIADMPGVKRENLDIAIEDGVLTISTTVEAVTEDSDTDSEDTARPRVIRRERRAGVWKRTLQLADDVAEEYVKASLSDGVLSLTLPKLHKPEPRKIDVEVA